MQSLHEFIDAKNKEIEKKMYENAALKRKITRLENKIDKIAKYKFPKRKYPKTAPIIQYTKKVVHVTPSSDKKNQLFDKWHTFQIGSITDYVKYSSSKKRMTSDEPSDQESDDDSVYLLDDTCSFVSASDFMFDHLLHETFDPLNEHLDVDQGYDSEVERILDNISINDF